MARFVGTGKDPQGRYPAGHIFDISLDDASGLSIVAEGWAEPLDPRDDPARTARQLAEEAVRCGGNAHFAHPVDRKLARDRGFVDDQGRVTPLAYDVVHEQERVLEGDARRFAAEAEGDARRLRISVATAEADLLDEDGTRAGACRRTRGGA